MDKFGLFKKLAHYVAAIKKVTNIDVDELFNGYEIVDENTITIKDEHFKFNDHPFYLEFNEYKQDDTYYLNMNVHLGYAIEMLDVCNAITRLGVNIKEPLIYYELVGGEEVYLPFTYEGKSELDSISVVKSWLTKLFSDDAKEDLKIITKLCAFTQEEARNYQ